MRRTQTHPRALRERVIAAIVTGASCRAAAGRFDVAVSSAIKWYALWRATGDVAPKQRGGHRRPLLEGHEVWIREQLEATPHLTIVQLQAALREQGITVSHDTVWRYVRHLGLSFKKKPSGLRAGPA